MSQQIYNHIISQMLAAQGYQIIPPQQPQQIPAQQQQIPAQQQQLNPAPAPAQMQQQNPGNLVVPTQQSFGGFGVPNQPMLTEQAIMQMTPEQITQNWDAIRTFIQNNGGA